MCTHTPTHTQQQCRLIDRDRQTRLQTEKRMSGKRVTEGKGKTERDAVIHSQIQIEADSEETNKKKDRQMDRATITGSVCPFASSAARLNVL